MHSGYANFVSTYRVDPPAEQIGDEEIYSVFGQTSVGHHGHKKIGTRCMSIFSGFIGLRFQPLNSTFNFLVCNTEYTDNANTKLKVKSFRYVRIFNDAIPMKFEDSFLKSSVKWRLEIFVRFKELSSFSSGGENCIEIFHTNW